MGKAKYPKSFQQPGERNEATLPSAVSAQKVFQLMVVLFQ
jgi:hypothetical protein